MLQKNSPEKISQKTPAAKPLLTLTNPIGDSMSLEPRKYATSSKQSQPGAIARKKAEAARALVYEEEAMPHNELHSFFFGVPNTPVRQIRERIDPLLIAREIREIYVDKDD